MCFYAAPFSVPTQIQIHRNIWCPFSVTGTVPPRASDSCLEPSRQSREVRTVCNSYFSRGEPETQILCPHSHSRSLRSPFTAVHVCAHVCSRAHTRLKAQGCTDLSSRPHACQDVRACRHCRAHMGGRSCLALLGISGPSAEGPEGALGLWPTHPWARPRPRPERQEPGSSADVGTASILPRGLDGLTLVLTICLPLGSQRRGIGRMRQRSLTTGGTGKGVSGKCSLPP